MIRQAKGPAFIKLSANLILYETKALRSARLVCRSAAGFQPGIVTRISQIVFDPMADCERWDASIGIVTSWLARRPAFSGRSRG